ncbi:conserved protein of unknown function [Georgfuchsia toluolica]|uniref:SPOR domain-containing protein n=1 Tax=Georgfuchsia toluolica TaxID=424218 RepID=A0A916N0V3_9PROT|nr:SPOR domain-containing protein [Georgfuchsia toluolica]CAG4884303.1 conserved protein of unknown function [Georgfuchsia toluolica]
METERQPDSLDEDALRRRLIKRIALAGVAIAALLGGLAVIDGMFAAPVPSSEPSAIVDAAKPMSVATTLPEPPPQAVPSNKISAAPVESSSSSAPLPRQLHPPAKPAEVKQAAVKPAPPHPLTQNAQTERHFVLQMGVFNNVDNAQELLARLLKNDVPAQIEARVQVGPFKTRAEADEARAKLKAMGLDAGLLMVIHR